MASESTTKETTGCPLGSCSSASPTLTLNYSLEMLGLNLSLPDNITGNGTADNSSLVSAEKNLLPEEAKASLIVLYTLTIIFSIVGNILVVIVFTKGRRCRTDIRPFLINLAVADLIMALFCMPFTFTFVMIRTWIFSKPMCPIVLFMQHLSVSASVFTNMAIGIDRFVVVTFPLRARMTTQRAKYTICIIWVCAVGLSSVQLVVGRATEYGDFVDCDERWSTPGDRRTFTMFVLFITYIIPLIILLVTYSIVSILLWKRTAPGNAHEGRDLQQLKAKRKVIKMLVLVVIMFGVCWLPLHTFFLVIDFNPQLMMNQTESQERLFTVIFYIAFWLAMSNSCANPIIYGFTNDSFRTDLASLFYLRFPFCMCLKKMATRKFSVSTYDSAYNKRFSTARKATPNNTLYRQGGYRNGSKVYIELRRDMSRERSLATMNEFYKETRDPEDRGVQCNGRNGHLHRHHHSRHHHHNHHHRHHNHAPLFKSGSGDSTKSLTFPYSNEMYESRSPTANGSGVGSPVSPDSLVQREFSFSGTDDSNSSSKLNPLPEVDSIDNADFHTV